MPTKEEIERRYIEQQLDRHGEHLNDLFIQAIVDKDLINSGDLLDYFDSASKWKVTTWNGMQTLQFEFPNYGRFVEIQANKVKRGLRTEKVDTNALIWGVKKQAEKKKKGKNAQWYTKNVYGAQNLLIGRLMYGLSDIEREKIVAVLKKETIQNSA
jgi:hypothetical protein